MIEYRDDIHEYSYRGQKYLSATQIVELFYEPFNAQLAAERYARKNGETPEYWLAKWEEKRQKSLQRGNRVHKMQEDILNGRMIDLIDGKMVRVQNPQIYPENFPYLEYADGIYPELPLWNHAYKIAGRSDYVRISTENGRKYAHVSDYKSNEEIEKESYYNPRTMAFKMMKPPISYLMDCNLVHYSLQLSLYMFMLESMGFEQGDMRIIHFPHPGKEEDPDPPPVIYPVKYMKKEVISMLSYIQRRKEHGKMVS